MHVRMLASPFGQHQGEIWVLGVLPCGRGRLVGRTNSLQLAIVMEYKVVGPTQLSCRARFNAVVLRTTILPSSLFYHSQTNIRVRTMAIKPAGRGPELCGVVGFFLALSTVAILLRAYCRAFLVKNFGLDDWFAVLAYVFVLDLLPLPSV